MNDAFDQARELPAVPAVTETAIYRAIRTVTAPMRGLRWRRVLTMVVVLTLVATLVIAAAVVGSTPWSIAGDGFLALERALTR